jgi:hypothetical protein
MGQSQTGQSLPLIFVLAQASIVVANVMAKEPRTPVSSTAPSPTNTIALGIATDAISCLRTSTVKMAPPLPTHFQAEALVEAMSFVNVTMAADTVKGHAACEVVQCSCDQLTSPCPSCCKRYMT